MITVQGLAYSYSSSKTIAFPDFKVNTGEPCLLLGESGSGKTTLLHLIGGLLSSQKGSINIQGTEITTLSESSRDRFRGKSIGFIFQRNHLIASLSVRQNLLLAPYLAGVHQNSNRVEEVLGYLDLAEKKNARIQELSQGQAQRVAIARAILNKPSVILADEPTSALDDKNCFRVLDLLITAAKDNQSTLLIATHDQRLKSRIANQIQVIG
jgi:putative ABC transport system ATP-binding protein